ncbi:Nicotinamidase-related amidase [Quadrisphaera granulorum]|uniref:Nicotinamidase-related amidase n=1 Tax=Quadrisphaera granulorum TaxID=317664 RepID=A0A315ZR01_9ACTN|nr:isochorismatase family protein [Quadrisphaera granulorum]PWJ47729.1 nicotinamidase-related amidase [Quadrisphaera granulorum]SZE98683.1 Nicotinamidase-related amidase [Quadrisphaera granulorum]
MTPPRRALVVVDIQQEYVSGPLAIQHPPLADSLPQILRALDAAADARLPVVVVQHDGGEGAPIFDPTQPGFALHPDVEARRSDTWKTVVKEYSSVFPGTDLLPWLREQGVDTITLVGFMSNNCVLASAVEAEALGLAVEVLSDATGAIHLTNDAGSVDAASLHRTLMALLHSNFATVTDTATWAAALAAGQSLPGDDLVASATRGTVSAAS